MQGTASGRLDSSGTSKWVHARLSLILINVMFQTIQKSGAPLPSLEVTGNTPCACTRAPLLCLNSWIARLIIEEPGVVRRTPLGKVEWACRSLVGPRASQGKGKFDRREIAITHPRIPLGCSVYVDPYALIYSVIVGL